MAAAIPSTPKPTTPTKAAPSKPSSAPTGKPAPSTPKPADDKSFIEKALEGAGVTGGGASDAKKGAGEAKPKATTAKKSAGESTGAAVGKGIEDGIKAAVDGGVAAVKVVAKVAEPIVGPTIREVKEAGVEIKDAGVKYGKDWFDSLNPLDDVGSIWSDKDQSIGSKIGATAGKVVENVIVEGARNFGNVLNLGKEVVEGAAEIALNSPGVNAVKEAAKGVWNLGGHVVSWAGDRIAGGAEGAVKASKTATEHGTSIWNRSWNQTKENAEEIGGAASDFGSGWVDSLNPFDGVSDAWSNGDGIGSKVGGVVGKVLENGVTEGVDNLVNGGKLVYEVGEAAVENVITTGANIVDGVAGAGKAVGDFVGGIFG